MDQIGDLIAQVGRLTGRLEIALDHVATKEDVAELRTKLDDHLEAHVNDRLMSSKIKLIAIAALVAGVPALITALAGLF